MVELVKEFASGIYNLCLGLFTTGKHLGRHAITVQYPKERWEMPERSRAMVVLLTDLETGKLNCTACLLCMKTCPSAAIDIEVVRDENKKRQLKEFKVDFNLCCFCGLCEESCNFAAIKLAPKYEFPAFDKSNLTWNMEKLAQMGLDVPYVKPEKKKPAAKPAVQKTAEDRKAEEKPENVPVPNEKTEEAAAEVKAEKVDEKPADDKPGQDEDKG